MQFEDMNRDALIEEILRLRKELQDLSAEPAGQDRVPVSIMRLMCDNVPDMIWAKDTENRYLFANKALGRRLLNAETPDEPLGKDDLFFAKRERERHPGNAHWHTFGEICEDSDSLVLQARTCGHFEEFGNVKGEYLVLDVRKAPIFDDEGTLLGTVGCGRDVTEKKRQEEELQRSESRFRNIFNSADVPIWELDLSEIKIALDAMKKGGVEDFRGHFREHPDLVPLLASTIQLLDVNPAALALHGAKSKDQLLGSLERLLVPEMHAMLGAFFLAMVEGHARFEYEAVDRSLDGRELNLLIRLCLPSASDDYHRWPLCLVDITEKKRMESERRKRQKLESLGVLAGGIAHDFNNLLMGITGSISLARMHLETGDPTAKRKCISSLDTAEISCERAKDLTHQLLTFAKGGTPVKKTLKVEELVAGIVSFSLSGSRVRGEFELAETLWDIEADRNQLTQVISNIVLNAVEAMPDGGTLRVKARNRKLRDSEIPQIPAGCYVEIRLMDHGVGIPEEHLPWVFDPFFSVKKGGRGLGLAIVHSVVVRHGGHVALESRPGEGTTVTLLLPALNPYPAELPPWTESSRCSAGRVLVMDDDEVVLETASAMLEHLGFAIETARDGRDMLDRYRRATTYGHPFDVVIMDLTIPGGMGGVEAMKELLDLDPDAKAIVSSGYSNDPVMANHRAHGFTGVVPKPYRIEELNQALSGILAGVQA